MEDGKLDPEYVFLNPLIPLLHQNSLGFCGYVKGAH